ncbi:hypothetical protein SAMN05444161_0574 [Rhizobiales bacterium GAS191]|nr:hypothetical protein SAMN05444161_0574 [Rhizobiales bacterium GAS191]
MPARIRLDDSNTPFREAVLGVRFRVMAGLVPAIHVLLSLTAEKRCFAASRDAVPRKAWMAGPTPGNDGEGVVTIPGK